MRARESDTNLGDLDQYGRGSPNWPLLTNIDPLLDHIPIKCAYLTDNLVVYRSAGFVQGHGQDGTGHAYRDMARTGILGQCQDGYI